MKLINDVKGAWKHYSTQALAVGAAIQGTWAAFPEDLKLALGPDIQPVIAWMTAGILFIGLVGKFIDQKP